MVSRFSWFAREPTSLCLMIVSDIKRIPRGSVGTERSPWRPQSQAKALILRSALEVPWNTLTGRLRAKSAAFAFIAGTARRTLRVLGPREGLGSIGVARRAGGEERWASPRAGRLIGLVPNSCAEVPDRLPARL